eukprot:TRINITY_DN6532_c0_g1_i2.p1 TRINITY_DN6532_c0_g1~~TRINITY_DN6532_c0_g1_i2.p1  ORF type:complete len:415 (-),score=58.61 TRINITY_DN6532_c0_g1_i2:1-1245(-)
MECDAIPAEDERAKVWRKNAPFVYDRLLTKELAWASLTVEWLPTKRYDAGTDCHVHQVLFGTHAMDEKNYLYVTDVFFPAQPKDLDPKDYDQATEEIGTYGTTHGGIDVSLVRDPTGKPERVNTRITLVHDGDVNRARHCPHNPNLVATKPSSPELLVFDLRKCYWKAKTVDTCTPQLRLVGHSEEGFGLSWSTLAEGNLASGGNDGTVMVWDISTANSSLESKFRVQHQGVVSDVQFHSSDQAVLASASDDRTAAIWDLRSASGALQLVHPAEVNALSFSPFDPIALATATTSGAVQVWDLRRPADPLISLVHHTAAAVAVRWSPFHRAILASAAEDGFTLLWDLSKVPEDQGRTDDVNPCLLFVHDALGGKVTDISWHTSLGDEFTIASTVEGEVANELHVWRMADSCYRNF